MYTRSAASWAAVVLLMMSLGPPSAAAQPSLLVSMRAWETGTSPSPVKPVNATYQPNPAIRYDQDSVVNSWLRGRSAQMFADDFDDGILDPNWWYSGGDVSEQDGIVRMVSVGGAAAGITTHHAFLGDCDVQVDFNLVEFPYEVACHAPIYAVLAEPGPFPPDDTNLVGLKRHRLGYDDRYQFFPVFDGVYGYTFIVPTTEMNGRMRLVRTGSEYHAFHWVHAWEPIGTLTHFTGPMILWVRAFGTTLPPSVTVDYDNFTAVAEGITGNLGGTVRNVVGGPVEGAVVSLTGQEPDQTDANGVYSFFYLEEGSYTLTVTKYGYRIAELTVQVQSALDIVADVTLMLRGDLNCDGAVNVFDIDPFVVALTDSAAYAAAFPDCDRFLADVNCDGAVNAFDIDPFVLCLTGGGCPPCP